MSCSCGAARPEECETLAELVQTQALSGDELELGVPWDKLHRAMWCLLHPLQCRRDPKTGEPIPAVGDLVLLGVVVYAWLELTKER